MIGKVSGHWNITYEEYKSVIFVWTTGSPNSGIFTKMTSTNNNRKLKYGKLTNQDKKVSCGIFKSKTKYNFYQ